MSFLRKFFTKVMSPQNRPQSGVMAVRDAYADIRIRVAKEDPVIVDGGANKGDMVRQFIGMFNTPIIHAFEPIPWLITELETTFADVTNVIIHPNALGQENKDVAFRVNNFDATSSVFPSTNRSVELLGDMVQLREQITVPMVRMEGVLDTDIDVIKLDLQGYELEALKGCGQLLKRTRIIITEVEFVELYTGQPLFSDIDLFLRKAGFKLLNLYNLYTAEDGQLLAGDAVYLNASEWD